MYNYKVNGSKVIIDVNIDDKEWNEGVNKVYESTKAKFNVVGFRKGHAPKKVIEQQYGDDVFYEDTLDYFIRKTLNDFLNENSKYEPVSYPNTKLGEYVVGEGIKFTIEFDIMPEFKLPAYTGLEFTQESPKVTDKEIELTKKYCGAVAVSYYSKLDKYGNEDNPSTISALERFVKAGCITNVHYVLSKKSIKEAIYRVKNGVFPKGINAVVFLLYKPIGLASRKHVIDCGDPDYLELLRLVASADSSWRYGFDTCQSPAIYKFASSIAIESIEFCEAARFSMYINSRCIAFPCSFGIEDDTFSVDLKQHTLREAWESESFAKFRKQQSEMCSNCNAGVCRSCGLGLEINLCGKVKKYL